MPLIYTPVNSSAIEVIGYDPATQQMTIRFRNKEKYPEYVWGGVPEEFAGNFLLAPSKGRFYHDFINRGDFYRVEPTLGSYKIGAVAKRIERAAKKKAAEYAIRGKVLGYSRRIRGR